MASVIDRVREQFPQFAFLLNHNEIGPLLRDAVDPNKGFSPARFNAELQATNWYKTQSNSKRQYEILKNTDKGEFQQQVRNLQHAVRMESKRLGVRLTNNEVVWIAHSMLQKGQGPDDPRLGLAILRIRHRKPGRVQYGAIRSSAFNTRAMANNEYYIKLDNKNMWKWGDNIARGFRTEADLRTFLKDRAIKRYPHLAPQLRSGQTMGDMFGGHVDTIAEELELNPAEIRPWQSSSKWSRVLGVPDPKTGNLRAMTEAETRTMARQDSRFWNTTNGRQMDAGMAEFLLQSFGVRK